MDQAISRIYTDLQRAQRLDAFLTFLLTEASNAELRDLEIAISHAQIRRRKSLTSEQSLETLSTEEVQQRFRESEEGAPNHVFYGVELNFRFHLGLWEGPPVKVTPNRFSMLRRPR